MSLRISLAAALLLITGSAYAQTQLELNKEACGNYHEAEQKLSDTYNEVLKEYASDEIFIENIKASQKAWLAYRDAQMKALYPHMEAGYYGSIYPVCECTERAYLTDMRIKELKRWEQGTPEGDVCAGSIKRSYKSQ